MKRALLPLTSFRFFAAVAVVMCHRPHPDGWMPYERFGGAGVTFFFLLSGFILAYTYHDRFVTRRPHAAREFLTARAARILPAYLLAFVLALWTCPMGKDILSLKFAQALWPALAHLTMTQALVPNMKYYFGFNPPAWSLSCEWTFYLLFPLLLLGLATGSILRRVAVFTALSAVWAVVLGLYLVAPVEPAREFHKWAWIGYAFPLTRVFDFACGVALGVLFVRACPEVGPARGYCYWMWGLVEVGALGALWAALHFCPVSPGAGGEQTFQIQMLTWQGYYLPFFAALVWIGALGRGPLARVMSWAPLVYLGELSYGIYIFHFPVLWLIVNNFPGAASGSVPTGAVLFVGAIGVLAVSALSYHFWEAPIRRWVRGRPSQPAVDVLPILIAFPQSARRAA
jgi:peptidoglycan/LPS O-acetylase OafA/YrhL